MFGKFSIAIINPVIFYQPPTIALLTQLLVLTHTYRYVASAAICPVIPVEVLAVGATTRIGEPYVTSLVDVL